MGVSHMKADLHIFEDAFLFPRIASAAQPDMTPGEAEQEYASLLSLSLFLFLAFSLFLSFSLFYLLLMRGFLRALLDHMRM